MKFVNDLRERTFRAGVGSVAFALVLAGCGGSEKDPGGGPTKNGAPPATLPASGRMSPLAVRGGPAYIELVALSRTSQEAITGRFKIVNKGKAPVEPGAMLGEGGFPGDPDAGDVLSASGIGLLDVRTGKVYLPRHTSGKQCLCSKPWGRRIPAGGAVDIYAVFPQVEGAEQLTVVMPTAAPFVDVPVTEGPVRPAPDQTIDPAKAQLLPPRALSLVSIADGDGQTVSEDADKRAVRLSADVLFALNKADLTPKADTLLRQTAEQIDASKGSEVTVGGYTDSSGNDAINQPLSERRAQAVADRLKSMVTRQGITFLPAGHGAKDPVAPNDSENGRRKNRRVTVTFAKPVPPSGPSAGTPYEGKPDVIGGAAFSAADAKDLKVQVHNLHRDSAGFTTMVWTLRNSGSTSVNFQSKLEKTLIVHGDHSPRRGSTVGGVMLYDPAAKVRYQPMYTSNGACICSALSADATVKSVGPGESVTLWSMYRVPAEVQSVEAQFPWAKADDAVIRGLPIR
ncbi:OmpA family protein [Actinomadura sp. GTD37]|uniref:OmpA family protein n=1 Tax=Actinomadura sp. GTD37 TaxID=1778030 RepID=UPI0035C0D2D7